MRKGEKKFILHEFQNPELEEWGEKRGPEKFWGKLTKKRRSDSFVKGD